MNNDLISRSELMKAISTMVEAEMPIDEKWALGLKHSLKVIDNAPPVAVNCKDCDGYEAGYSAGLKDAENPSGDAISREALKKTICLDEIISVDETWEQLYDAVVKAIDNAPTVEPRIEYGTDGQPYKLSMTNGKEYERPQGDCVSRKALKGAIENQDKFACLPDTKLVPFRMLNEPEKNYEPYVHLRDIRNAIDNAPTVEPERQVEKINKIPKDFVYDTETPEFYCYRNKYTGKEIHILKEPKTYTLERPQGDCISREALGKEISELDACDIGYDEYVKKGEIEKLIDNAPAVETFTQKEKEEIADAINYLLGAELLEENGYTEEVINALKSALKKVVGQEE